MKRVAILLGLIGASLVALFTVLLWYLVDYQSGRASFEGFMGQMMGSTGMNGTARVMPTWVWVVVVTLAALAVVGVVGLGYSLAFPEIRSGTASQEVPPVPTTQGA